MQWKRFVSPLFLALFLVASPIQASSPFTWIKDAWSSVSINLRGKKEMAIEQLLKRLPETQRQTTRNVVEYCMSRGADIAHQSLCMRMQERAAQAAQAGETPNIAAELVNPSNWVYALQQIPQRLARDFGRRLARKSALSVVPGIKVGGVPHAGRCELVRMFTDCLFDTTDYWASAGRCATWRQKFSQLSQVAGQNAQISLMARPVFKLLLGAFSASGGKKFLTAPLIGSGLGLFSKMSWFLTGTTLGQTVEGYIQRLLMELWDSKTLIPRKECFIGASPMASQIYMQVIAAQAAAAAGSKG